MPRPRLPKLPKNVEELAEWYMRYISPFSLVGGFLADNLILLRRVDLWTSNALLFFYLVLAGCCIILLNVIETGRLQQKWILKITPLIPVVAQFAFGGLFSGYLSLYSRSAAYQTSWIFVLLIAGLLLGNERFVRSYRRFPFQLGIFFTVLFSFLIFFLPVVFREIGPYMFIASGVVSLGAITGFYYLLAYFTPERAASERTRVARIVAVIFVTFNILYFTGAIPPLPLALKDAGVYHGVVRTGDEYRLFYEPLPWYESFLRYNITFHRAPNEPAYVFTAIFAPTDLTTTIFHEWQLYDESRKAWVTEETVPFYIVGGRDGGYRGYSVKTNPAAGSWRVNVITSFGQTIGRVAFNVVATSSPVHLETEVK